MALAASQLVGLAVARYAVQLPALVAADTEDVVRSVAPVLQHYLTGNPLAASKSALATLSTALRQELAFC